MAFIYVPLVRQAYEYSCGAASLASCLYYWKVWDGREPQLYPALETDDEGTSGVNIVKVAQSYGLMAFSRSEMNVDDLRGYLKEGCTVILSIQAWGDYTSATDMMKVWEDGHYVVLVGISGDQVTMMDPGVAGQYRKISILELNQCWHDYSDEGEYDYYGGIVIKGR
jgi:predicted double-glycine peptidase